MRYEVLELLICRLAPLILVAYRRTPESRGIETSGPMAAVNAEFVGYAARYIRWDKANLDAAHDINFG